MTADEAKETKTTDGVTTTGPSVEVAVADIPTTGDATIVQTDPTEERIVAQTARREVVTGRARPPAGEMMRILTHLTSRGSPPPTRTLGRRTITHPRRQALGTCQHRAPTEVGKTTTHLMFRPQGGMVGNAADGTGTTADTRKRPHYQPHLTKGTVGTRKRVAGEMGTTAGPATKLKSMTPHRGGYSFVPSNKLNLSLSQTL